MLKIEGWIWIAKYDSLLTSVLQSKSSPMPISLKASRVAESESYEVRGFWLESVPDS